MLLIPILPVKVEFTAMLRMLTNAKNAERGLGGLGGTLIRLLEWGNGRQNKDFVKTGA